MPMNPGMRATVEEGNPGTLARHHCDIRAELTRWNEHGERKEICGDGHLCAVLLRLRDHASKVADLPAAPRVGRHESEELPSRQFGVEVDQHDLDPNGRRAGAHHVE